MMAMTDGRTNPLRDECSCEGCHRLRLELAGDRRLTDVYGRQLLQRGWAGRTSPAEAAYIRAQAGWAQAAARSLRAIAKPSDDTATAAAHDPEGINQEQAA